MKTQTCALRALSVCDGQVLEEPDHALSSCRCAFFKSATREGRPRQAQEALNQRDRLVREAAGRTIRDARPTPAQGSTGTFAQLPAW